MKKIGFIVALCILFVIITKSRLSFTDNIIQSLQNKNPTHAQIFKNFQKNSFFENKIFVNYAQELSATDIENIDTKIQSNGYKQTQLFNIPANQTINDFVVLLPLETINKILSAEELTKRSSQAYRFATLPGSNSYFSYLQNDPLGLQAAIFSQVSALFSPGKKTQPSGTPEISKTESSKAESLKSDLAKKPTTASASANPLSASSTPNNLRIYVRTEPIVYDKFADLYHFLTDEKLNIKVIGGDLFAYENYVAVKKDINFCMLLSLPLNLLLFLLFVRRFSFLVFLIAGSAISYITGLFLVSLVYFQIYAVVIAFTSAFVCFNNEYLVHLSGLSANDKRHNYIGLSSAIGSFFIAFVVLMYGNSVIIKQTALVTIGGMLGFLGFLWLYKDVLDKIVIHCFKWKSIFITPKIIYALFICAIGFFALTPNVNFATKISSFKFESPFLEKQRIYFENAANSLEFSNVYAFSVGESPLQDLKLLKEKIGTITNHPLDFYQDAKKQKEVIVQLNEKYQNALVFFQKSLNQKGLNLKFDEGDFLKNLHRLSEKEYLNKIGEFFPIPWFMTTNDQSFLLVNSKTKLTESDLLLGPTKKGKTNSLIPMSPETYYNDLLTDITKQMVWLLLGGCALMFFYLLLIQKNLARVMYIFTPFIFSMSFFKLFLNYKNSNFHIIHMMGWAIVLALATDYTSVSVSWRHNKIQLNKILLTGLSTFLSFGILCFASSPVLKELGLTVFLGTITSLLFALFFALKLPEKSQYDSTQ